MAWGRPATKVLQERNFQQKAEKKISVQALLSDLKACSRAQDLQRGKKVHAEAVARGQDSNIYVQSTLVRMYAKCGSIVDARCVFENIEKPNVVSWTALVSGYAENGEGHTALDMFSRMKASGCVPDSVTYLAALKACTSLAMDRDGPGKKNCLKRGREIHSEIGKNIDHYVQNTLIDMYAKCGSMVDARCVFDSIQKPNVVSWTALLLGYAENGEGLVALDMFSRMKASGCAPNSITYVAALKACTSLAVDVDCNRKESCLEQGREIHSEIGSGLDLYIQSTLIDMYAKCGSTVDARRVFDSIVKPNVVCWNALLSGYAENGEALTALDMFSSMKTSGCAPDSVTYLPALKACTSLAVDGDSIVKKNCLEQGREIHLEIGRNLNLYIQSTLIDMYSMCGCMVDARCVFDSVQKPDVVCWNALLLGYAENGESFVALDMFSRMKASGCAPNSVTYVAALKSCTSLAVDGDSHEKKSCLEQGRKIHSEIGSSLDLYIQSMLVDMYAKCGSVVDARGMFDSIQKPNVLCWNALLLGYAENGEGVAALDMFSRMKASGCPPNPVTYVAALKACTSLTVDGGGSGKFNCLERGREIHLEIGSNLDLYIQSTLIDMYAKCGSILDARRVFDSVQKPNVVCWNALLLGYAENGEGFSALDMFSRMKASGCAPNSVTYVAALKACASLAVDGGGCTKKNCLERGREIHVEIGSNLDLHTQSTLIDMYAKCGSILDARRVFDSIQKPDVVSWTALVLGYAENGEGVAALDTFSSMKATGCAPNSVTYIAALKACGLVGALAFGRKLHSEITDFSAHVVTCLVDFYGKCGSMVEAHEVFLRHPKSRAIATWNALLAGYGRFGDSDSVFNLFQAMQDEGIRPDAVTLVCVLSCCSHAGLVGKAREFFEGMDVRYGVTPGVIHYSCMIDVLGRANLLNEAVGLLRKMPCNPDAVTWSVLLGACHKWKNLEIGKMAFQSLVGQDEKVAAAHVLMAQIYGSNCIRVEQGRVLGTRTKVGSAGQAYVLNEVDKMVKFVVAEQCPQRLKEQLCEDMKEHGHGCNVSDAEKEEAVDSDSEGRAFGYGIVKTPFTEPRRVCKNMDVSTNMILNCERSK